MTVVILRGAPGSGKSTWAKEFKKKMEERHPKPLDVEICSADEFMTDEDGNYSFDKKRLEECHEKCWRKFIDAIDDSGVEFIVVDNTNTRRWEFEKYVQAAKDANCHYVVYCFTGQHENVHGVPPETVKKMRERMEKYPFEYIIS